MGYYKRCPECGTMGAYGDDEDPDCAYCAYMEEVAQCVGHGPSCPHDPNVYGRW